MTARASPALRLPDFVVIGTMKSGTTTLYRWLGAHPACALTAVKEPGFFSDDEAWCRGVGWYASLFAHAGEGQRTGEASVSYTDPARAATAARRLLRTVPDARLVCVVRHPIERLRSHYRHEVQRGRERRGFAEAVTAPGNSYVARSRYATCLRPWVECFGADGLHVVRLEDLAGDGGETWAALLTHLDLEPVPRPGEAFNVTATKGGYTRPVRVLWERGLLPDARRLPAPLRRGARRLLLRTGGGYARRVAESSGPAPEAVAARVWADVADLPALLGEGAPRW